MKAYKILLFLLVFIPSFASAQCKPFTKNKVLPKLNGYVQNDSYNSAQMAPGEDAEFTVSDINGKQIYTNKDAQDKEAFEFKMKNTQQLVIKIKVPEQKDAVVQHIGCISIVSGFKQ
jgi:hypothetical protein